MKIHSFILLIAFEILLFQTKTSGNSFINSTHDNPLSYLNTLALVENTKGFTAMKYIQNCSIYDGNKKLLGSTKTLRTMNNAGNWETTETTVNNNPGIFIAMDLGIPQDPSDVFEDFDQWKLIGNDVIMGRTLEIWEGKSTSKKGQTTKLWIFLDTYRPHKVEFTLPTKYMFREYVFFLNITYSSEESLTMLPVKSILETKGKYFFRKRNIVIETEYKDWRYLPSQLKTQPF